MSRIVCMMSSLRKTAPIGGVITHVIKSYQEGEDLRPEMMVEEAKEAIEKKQ